MRMQGLKGLILGLAAGLVLGSTVPASAVFSWVAGSTLQGANRNFQLGYVAGVDDAVQSIVGSKVPSDTLKQKADCLAKHHSSLGLATFGDWALTLSGTERTAAAGLILQKACQ